MNAEQKQMVRIHSPEHDCEECVVLIAPGQLGFERRGCSCLCHIPANADDLATRLFMRAEMGPAIQREMAQALIDSVERQAKAFLKRLADHREGRGEEQA